MKKFVTIIASMILMVCLLSGCGKNQTPVPQPESSGSQPVQTPLQNTVDISQFIGEDKAKEIALNRAELTVDQVVFDRVELDFDDGVYRYEVEFRQGNTEYDADIKADDGTIISWDIDRD